MDEFADQDLQGVAIRALELEECLRLYRASPSAAVTSPNADSPQMLKWQQAVAPGVHELFALRLSWDGVEPSRWRTALGGLSALPGGELPAWVRWLPEVAAQARTLAARADDGAEPLLVAADGSQPPFVELWLPFLAVGRRALRERLSEQIRALLSPAAWREAERDLIAQLAGLAERCAYQTFHRFRSAEAESVTTPLAGVYRRFVRTMLGEGLRSFLLEYGALARRLCAFTTAWVEANAEWLLRLETDRIALAERFGNGADPGPVATLRAGLSDRHHGGRQVAALIFSNGLRLLYKPKSLQQDDALARLLEWFAARGLEDVPPTARVLAREGYGWAEFVETSPVESPEEVRRYYRQAGVLLACIYLLNGNDCVMDNLIATRRGPVLIDLETLFQPRAAHERQSTVGKPPPGASLEPAQRFVRDSVLRTGLLTTWGRTPAGALFDLGGLAGGGGSDTGRRRLVWREINTDAMRPATEPILRPAQLNLLHLRDRPAPARDHIASLEAGFRAGTDAWLAHRDELAGPDGLLRQLFGGCRTRFLLRPTNVYSVLLKQLSPPDAWKEGPDRGMAFECLLRPFVQRAEPGPPPALWPLLQREREALERHDIPHFTIAADSADLVLADGRRVPGVFAESGLDLALERLEALRTEDIEAQVGLLRVAFHRPADDERLATVAVPESRAELENTAPLSVEELLGWARKLADGIAARAVPSGEEAVVWVSPAGLRLDEQALRGGNYYLYDGNCGVALFLAAAVALTGESAGRRELIQRACRPVDAMLTLTRNGAPEDARMKGLGICVGLGSAVYAFTRIGEFLDEPAYLEIAGRAAREISPERIAADRTFDLFHGAAGAIPALLAFHRAAGEKSALETALRCGRHLVAHQRPARAGGAAWTVLRGRMPVGFAHGAAGIVYALARLGKAAETDEFFPAIALALEYERALFRPEALNWPLVNWPEDSAPPEPPVFLNAWCNGAAGVGLGRLGLLDAVDDDRTRAEIDAALRKNCFGGLPRVDFLCCGNFGRIEFLLTAGQRVGNPAAAREAQRRAALAVRRAEANGGTFSLGPEAGDDQCFQPGLFRGLAGIGYGLLRLAAPETTPSVLLFE